MKYESTLLGQDGKQPDRLQAEPGCLLVRVRFEPTAVRDQMIRSQCAPL